MKLTLTLLFIVALVAVAFALIAWAVAKVKDAYKPRRRFVVGNASRWYFRRHVRKVFLAPLLIERVAGMLGFCRMPRGGIQFCNIGEGTHEHGIKSYIPDAATASRYLLYKVGSDADHCAVCGLGDDPLGSSDDLAEASNLDVPIAIKLFGAIHGTTRVVTDGTVVNKSWVKTGANGQVTLAASGDAGICGRAIIPTDASAAAGEVIQIIPMAPAKYAF